MAQVDGDDIGRRPRAPPLAELAEGESERREVVVTASGVGGVAERLLEEYEVERGAGQHLPDPRRPRACVGTPQHGRVRAGDRVQARFPVRLVGRGQRTHAVGAEHDVTSSGDRDELHAGALDPLLAGVDDGLRPDDRERLRRDPRPVHEERRVEVVGMDVADEYVAHARERDVLPHRLAGRLGAGIDEEDAIDERRRLCTDDAGLDQRRTAGLRAPGVRPAVGRPRTEHQDFHGADASPSSGLRHVRQRLDRPTGRQDDPELRHDDRGEHQPGTEEGP